jgi:hypothetical protein
MAKLITTIHKLPLNIFIDALVDSDFTGLILEDEPTQEEILQVWGDLVTEYTEALGDDGQKQYVKASTIYQQAHIRYELVNNYIELLNNWYVPRWAQDLNRLVGAGFKFDPSNKEAYRELLKRCYNRNQGNLMHVELAKMELESVAKLQAGKDGKGTAPDRAYFTKVLTNLWEFMGDHVPDTISTYQFCVLVNRLSDYIKNKPKEVYGRGKSGKK